MSRPAGPAVAAGEYAVAGDEVGAQESCAVQVLDGGLEVSPHDLLELDEPLAHVGLDAHTELVRLLPGRLEQVGGAGVHLGGVEHPPHPVVDAPVVSLDELDGFVEALPAFLLVPLVAEAPPLVEAPGG